MDGIIVEGLVVPARVGVTAEERAQPQEVRVDLELHLDLDEAGRSDDLSDTLDYSEVTSSVSRLLKDMEAHLLEHVAESVAAMLLRRREVEGVTVQVKKLLPPVPERVEAIGVRIERP